MSFYETAITFSCAGAPSVAILHHPVEAMKTGVLIIVGGPQYRIGSHRQFVLLARALAAAGIPALRFDHRGIGDCSGPRVSFEEINDDIRCAIDLFMEQVEIDNVILWGLCDAAAAAMMYGPTDKRISGMILLNPWVHTEITEAQVRFTSYYRARLKNKQFWRKLLTLDVDVRDSLTSILGYVRKVAPWYRLPEGTGQPDKHFVDRMRLGLEQFVGDVFLVLSGNDLTADEFRSLVSHTKTWRNLVNIKVTESVDLADANHTFASREWRELVERKTIQWVKQTNSG